MRNLPVLLMEVTEIRGRCLIYEMGDKIVIDGARTDLHEVMGELEAID